MGLLVFEIWVVELIFLFCGFLDFVDFGGLTLFSGCPVCICLLCTMWAF